MFMYLDLIITLNFLSFRRRFLLTACWCFNIAILLSIRSILQHDKLFRAFFSTRFSFSSNEVGSAVSSCGSVFVLLTKKRYLFIVWLDNHKILVNSKTSFFSAMLSDGLGKIIGKHGKKNEFLFVTFR